MAVDDRDNLEIIKDSLREYGGRQKHTGSSIFIVCPFHGDNDPSLGVYVGTDGKFPLGSFHCFGCNEKGQWHKLAKEAGFPLIKEWKKEQGVSSLISKELEDSLLGEHGTTLKSIFKAMDCEEAQKWPRDVPWRGYSGELIHKVGGHIINDSYNDSISVLFPVKVTGKIRGGIKALYRRTSKFQKAYITSKGEWIQRYGLFPYDYTKHLIEVYGFDFVILVEGPRDCLRFLNEDLPAVAVLGASSFSSLKHILIKNLGVNVVYVVPDNDKGGRTMWKTIRKHMTDTKLVRLELPKTDSKGNPKKIDPGNMSNVILNQILEYLDAKHDIYE